MEIRNIAIIAHVDHGKTTLVDRMIYQANLVRRPEDLGNLILDNNDLERERGITILAKNVSVTYKGVKINIIDTPGHSDFGGEVERVLNMADGVLLLVDAFEGCMPQTRFVLQKAIEMGKKPVVVINKVDKPNCRPDEVQEEVFDLMFNLGATEDQLDFKTVYGSAKLGWMGLDWKTPTGDITPLLDTILEEIPAPQMNEGTPQMLISSLEYSPYVGRIAVGRITRGTLRTGMQVSLCKRYDVVEKSKIKQLMVFEGLGKSNVDTVECGDICAVVGVDGFEIGDTIADFENPEALPPIAVDEPTMSMLFMINNSPFFGKDGKYVTSRHIKERLERELEKNLALRVKPGVNADSFVVYGRGVLHLSVLIETMRREGFELQVGQPKVLDKTIGGQRCEPIEELSIEVPEEFVGAAIEISTRRKGALIRMEPRGDRPLLEFEIPTRGLMGLRSNLLTATQGEAVVAHPGDLAQLTFVELCVGDDDCEGGVADKFVFYDLDGAFHIVGCFAQCGFVFGEKAGYLGPGFRVVNIAEGVEDYDRSDLELPDLHGIAPYTGLHAGFHSGYFADCCPAARSVVSVLVVWGFECQAGSLIAHRRIRTYFCIPDGKVKDV